MPYGAFFSFCELIAEYLERTRHTYNYLLVEIVLSDEPIVSGSTALTLIRLTRFIGFRLVNLPYYAPDPLIIRNKESCRAALMMFGQPQRTKIEADELIAILRIVYFRHYGDWYRRIMKVEEFQDYERAITKSFDQMSSFIRAEKIVKINGMRNLELPYIVQPGSKISASFAGYLVLVALPAILTIAIAIEQETRLTAAVAASAAVVFILVLVPRFRRTLLRFFQLEQ
jgi:hypothetical protein